VIARSNRPKLVRGLPLELAGEGNVPPGVAAVFEQGMIDGGVGVPSPYPERDILADGLGQRGHEVGVEFCRVQFVFTA
jgi:hypothetical protein